MKTKLFLLGLCASIAFLGACDDSDDDKPETAVDNAFHAQYQGATHVEWGNHGSFREVDFKIQGVDYEAWYTHDAAWLQTEHEVAYATIPEVVKTLVSQDINYPSNTWRPDYEAELLERRNYLDWYAVELNVTFWSDAKGLQHRIVTHDLSGKEIPQEIVNTINNKYPGSYYEDVEVLDDNSYWVNLFHGKEVKQVYFTAAKTWDYTEWEVPANELPGAVQTTLKGEAYADYSVEVATYQERLSDGYYYIMLKNPALPDAKPLIAKIHKDGSLVE